MAVSNDEIIHNSVEECYRKRRIVAAEEIMFRFVRQILFRRLDHASVLLAFGATR